MRTGVRVQRRLLEILNALGEHSRTYAEPDVLLDFHEAGIVSIKAAYDSRNEEKSESYTGWRCTSAPEAFRDPTAAKKTGFYGS